MSIPPGAKTKNQDMDQRQASSSSDTHTEFSQDRYLERSAETTPSAIDVPLAVNRSVEMDTPSLPYEVLDLAIDTADTSDICRRAMKLLANARRIIVVAGAGISVAAGIPDFRSPAGLFSTLKADTKYKPSGKALFDASVYKVASLKVFKV